MAIFEGPLVPFFALARRRGYRAPHLAIAQCDVVERALGSLADLEYYEMNVIVGR